MKPGSLARIDALIDEADRQPFVGWDFSWIEGRITSAPLPWDYTAAVDEQARRSPDLVDLGTGGGEWLASLPVRPALTVATEAWPPNVPLARARLAPLGAHVVQVAPARDNTCRPLDGEGAGLPFASRSLHLVTSRHESFEVREVARVLAPGGWLITQQVDAGNDIEYQALLGGRPEPVDPRDRWEAWFPRQLEDAGLKGRRAGFRPSGADDQGRGRPDLRTESDLVDGAQVLRRETPGPPTGDPAAYRHGWTARRPTATLLDQGAKARLITGHSSR